MHPPMLRTMKIIDYFHKLCDYFSCLCLKSAIFAVDNVFNQK